ncbi:MAG: glycosyltransferase [Flavobacteriaceae bacterium]|nr:glycosyltransferase [Flavobacteriaceae bacterium]
MDASISIIITIFNRKDELSELLNSLSFQTDKDFESIIVDDGSTEDLSLVIKKFQNHLDLKYFKKENSGAGLSRNFGAEKAKNSWLIFVDSDAVVEQNYIQNIKNNILKHSPDAFGGADKADENFSPLQKAISYSMTSFLTTGGIRGNKNSIDKFQPRSFNMGIKKEVFQNVGGFSEMRIGEDPDLSMRLWENGYKTYFFDDIAVFHKRRTTLSQFEKQVYNFGIARPILNLRHPKYAKITFWLPSLFVLSWVISNFYYLVFNFKWILGMQILYLLMIFIHSSFIHKSLYIGGLSIITTLTQLVGYGSGFLNSWFQLNILKKTPEEAFPNHFYHKKN